MQQSVRYRAIPFSKQERQLSLLQHNTSHAPIHAIYGMVSWTRTHTHRMKRTCRLCTYNFCAGIKRVVKVVVNPATRRTAPKWRHQTKPWRSSGPIFAYKSDKASHSACTWQADLILWHLLQPPILQLDINGSGPTWQNVIQVVSNQDVKHGVDAEHDKRTGQRQSGTIPQRLQTDALFNIVDLQKEGLQSRRQ